MSMYLGSTPDHPGAGEPGNGPPRARPRDLLEDAYQDKPFGRGVIDQQSALIEHFVAQGVREEDAVRAVLDDVADTRTGPLPEAAAPFDIGLAPDDSGTAPGVLQETREALLNAGAAFDARGVAKALDALFAVRPLTTLVTDVVLPTAQAIGDAWYANRISITVEHVLSQAISRRMGAILEEMHSPRSSYLAVLASPPGCTHQLGLLSFAALLKESGTEIAYVGTDMPLWEWRRLMQATPMDAVVTNIATTRDIGPMHQAHDQIRTITRDVIVAVGGREQTAAPDGCLLLGHDMAAAVDRLNEALESRVGTREASTDPTAEQP